jgi:FkbM family methyltransferase
VGRFSVAEYRLADSPLRAVIRHPMTDMAVLREVFRVREYEPPAEVMGALAELQHVRTLDLGGHVGLFGLYAHSVLPATVVSFEPDPRNLPLLRRCVEINGLQERWTIVPAAAGTADGEAAFISDFSRSQIAAVGAHQPWETWIPPDRIPEHLAPTSATVPVVDALPHLQRCDLLKIDIEGGEWDLLADPRFAETTARALVMEIHPDSCPGDPRRTVDDHLSRAGFRVTTSTAVDGVTQVLWAHRT